jgi:hypothetical protein
MDSQGALGCEGMMLKGQASPRLTLLMRVRVEGQIGARESMRVVHSVGRGMIGTEEATVVGWARR